MSDHDDLSSLTGQIGSCLEAAEMTLDSLDFHEAMEENRDLIQRAYYLITAARTVNDQLAHATNLR